MCKNDDLHFPVFKTTPPPHRPLTMDEYDEFIENDLRETFDRDAYLREKKLREVHVMFRIDN
jgi:hypothetical protein